MGGRMAGSKTRITGESFALEAWHDAPLELAGRLVQEDLCLMQREVKSATAGRRGALLPAHWRLADKLPAAEAIHAPVPGFGDAWRAGRSLLREHPGRAAGVAGQLEPRDQPTLFLPPEHRAPQPISAEGAGGQLWLGSSARRSRLGARAMWCSQSHPRRPPRRDRFA
jgi:hypothetical protein